MVRGKTILGIKEIKLGKKDLALFSSLKTTVSGLAIHGCYRNYHERSHATT